MRIIAGPCQHETLAQSSEIARECKRVCDKYGIEYYFKASYDKANRTSANGMRGQGLYSTLFDFREIKKTLGVKTLTDVHDERQVYTIRDEFEDAVDVLQIPAFLCRQTDLIKAACATDCIVNIKKGQFLAPWDVKGILSKTEGAKEVWITERGTSFGYNTLVVDFTGLQYMLEHYDVPCVGGNRDYVPGLARAAAAMGVSNFFLEVHADPDNAPSDGPNMLNLKDFEQTVKDIIAHCYTGENK